MSVSCDDGDPAQAWNEKTQRARKPHTCSACKLTIRPGDTYTRDKLLYDGRWDLVIRCARCQLIFEHLHPLCSAEGDAPARELDCGHDYNERWDRDPPEWLAALAFWLPGDPLPATYACISLLEMAYNTPWIDQVRVCTNQVYSSYWKIDVGHVNVATSCATLEETLSRGRRVMRPTKGDASCTEVCS
jgi:hypothetical protein